jgi:hypothetical protein
MSSYFESRWWLYLIFVAVFLAGVLVMYELAHYKLLPSGKRLDLVMSAVFGVIAVILTFNLVSLGVRFTDYVNETLPRDQAQDECGYNATRAITAWLRAIEAQNQAALYQEIFVTQATTDGNLSEADLYRLNGLTQDAVDARVNMLKVIRENPLPVCDKPVRRG